MAKPTVQFEKEKEKLVKNLIHNSVEKKKPYSTEESNVQKERQQHKENAVDVLKRKERKN